MTFAVSFSRQTMRDSMSSVWVCCYTTGFDRKYTITMALRKCECRSSMCSFPSGSSLLSLRSAGLRIRELLSCFNTETPSSGFYDEAVPGVLIIYCSCFCGVQAVSDKNIRSILQWTVLVRTHI
jgi:hypothetical protein